MSTRETTVKIDRQYLGRKTKHELEVLVMQLMDMNDAWRSENEKLRELLKQVLDANCGDRCKLRAMLSDDWIQQAELACGRCKIMGRE